MLPEMWSATDKIFCLFEQFFALFPPSNNPENQNFERMKNKTCRYYHFTLVYHKYRSYDLWFLRYGAWQTEFFVILGYFCPLTSLTTQKIKILIKFKKCLEISSFYTCVPQMTITWCMILEIWSAIDIIFLSFWTSFCPFMPYNNPENQTFEKMNKILGDIIILHKCTIKGNHIMYGSWDIKRDRQNVLSFWAIFCPFTPLTTQKIKILKTFIKNRNHLLYCSWEMAHDGCNCFFFHFGLFFAFLPP